ncbi:hypothetical protein N7495_005406 [Penicillium taxi]|uniref:uncharacterized protein n=1 Tax=Penicillium taxi TaxID=168475 RepID=UPI00254520F5|nr:uncharacterized protein N7495_005406 [Penicillium taxi]KAJ5893715.1 hypothetical protein N7495_005406 [Penicillium taxi]
MSPTALRNVGAVDIVNIHQDDLDFSLVNEIYHSIDPSDGKQRSFPTLLLYDANGLKLFERITYLDEYYLTNAEIEVLTTHAKKIVEWLPENAQLVELGSGNLRKIEILLRECERTEKRVDYYALDLSLVELQRTFSEISPESFSYVEFHGLHGTYDDALTWLEKPENRKRPTVVLTMGSSMGNFTRSGAAEFLGRFSKVLNPTDYLLVGLDACKDPEKVHKAYNDSQHVTRRFYENGLQHANAVLGFEAFKSDEWDIVTGYNIQDGLHQAAYSPKVDVKINDIIIPRGEKLVFEGAVKYGREDRDELFRNAELILQVEFGNSDDNYHIHLLSPAALEISTNPSHYASHSVPSLKDFQVLWTAWDLVTKSMISHEELLSKPIKLRNELIFYLGHIPTFLDIHITRAVRGHPTDPKNYRQIFERGIDPDVENPEVCHAHSDIPKKWPHFREIINYQERVRSRVRSLLSDKNLLNDRILGEALFIGYEHEAMHLETFLYALLQSNKVLPPVGVKSPDFANMAEEAKTNNKPNQWFCIPKQTFSIGLNDSNQRVIPKDSFGWDNEKPQREITVHSFEAQARPITNGEYAKYLQANNIHILPTSWVDISSDQSYPIATGGIDEGYKDKFAVRTVFGSVALAFAQDWPLMASYDELASYAKWVGCRIPSFEEVRSIYLYADQLRNESSQSDGIHGAPNEVKTGPVFRDIQGCNVGFKHWHPTPVTPNGDKLAGQGDFGGVWEWTSTPLMPHEGFEAMEVYPGYTSDFFDGKHNIIQGGSWATLPRIAGRTTFVNWYQHNYLYAWAGARLVRDLNE